MAILRGFSKKDKNHILVIGSVLVDIIVSVDRWPGALDERSNVNDVRLGGCAFNIYHHLKYLEQNVQLITALREGSPFTKIIASRLVRLGVRQSNVFYSSVSREGMFVGFLNKASIQMSATSTVIDAATLNFEKIKAELSNATICCIDLSLSIDQLRTLLPLAARTGCSIVANGTSDGRINVLKELDPQAGRLSVLVCSSGEAEALLGASLEKIKSMDPREICAQARSSTVVVTLGASGWMEFRSENQHPISSPAPIITGTIVSTAGAGDALTACYISEFLNARLQNRPFDNNAFKATVDRLMPLVLGDFGATPTSASKLSNHIDGDDESAKFLGLSGLQWIAVTGVAAIFGTIIASLTLLSH